MQPQICCPCASVALPDSCVHLLLAGAELGSRPSFPTSSWQDWQQIAMQLRKQRRESRAGTAPVQGLQFPWQVIA